MSVSVSDHRGNRLIDLMGDRGRQLPHGHDAIGVRERLSFFLRPPAFGHIHHGPDTILWILKLGRIKCH